MSLRINTNVDALTAYRNLTTTQSSMSNSIERLSSGLRINKAADDAAGLAISQGLTAQINGIGQAMRNAQDGINVVQTADGALTETHSILQRMRTLSVQAANDSNDVASRADIQTEVDALNKELDRIASKTTFNNVNLLDGTSFNNKQFQIGYAANDTISVSINSAGSNGAYNTFANGAAALDGTAATFTHGGVVTTTAALAASSDANSIASALNGDANFKASYNATVDSNGGLVVTAKDGISGTVAIGGGLTGANVATSAGAGAGGFSSTDLGVSAISLTTQAGAETAITAVDTAIQAVSTARAGLGALQNRFQHTINNLAVTQQNLQASNSAIQDTDMASEMSNYTRSQILSQAGTSMLKQANQAAQSVLSLLQ
jgi:flagellin